MVAIESRIEVGVDEQTEAFVRTHPWLAAKLVLLEGLRPLRERPKAHYTSQTSEKPQPGFSDRLKLWEGLHAVESLVGQTLEGKITPKMEVRLSRWQSGHPPAHSDFRPREHRIIEAWSKPLEWGPASSFVQLASDLMPVASNPQAALEAEFHTAMVACSEEALAMRAALAAARHTAAQ